MIIFTFYLELLKKYCHGSKQPEILKHQAKIIVVFQGFLELFIQQTFESLLCARFSATQAPLIFVYFIAITGLYRQMKDLSNVEEGLETQ